MTGTPRCPLAHWYVSGSSRSPARNRCRNRDRSYPPIRVPSGSSRRIARIAVGAVNMVATPCSATTRQNAPASGVPTGLPSYSTVVQPASSGAYTMYECPTTQPTSDAAQNTSPGAVS
jgi:hypothetical protein